MSLPGLETFLFANDVIIGALVITVVHATANAALDHVRNFSAGSCSEKAKYITVALLRKFLSSAGFSLSFTSPSSFVYSW